MIDQRWWVAACTARRIGTTALAIALVGYTAACGGDDDDASSAGGGGTAGGSAGSGGSAAGEGGEAGGNEGGSGNAGSGGGSSAGSGGKTGPRMAYPTGLLGDFNIKLTARKDPSPLDPNGTAAVTSVLAILTDAPKPLRVQLIKTAEEGECELLEPEVPSCEMSCAAMDAVCTADDVCTPNPKAYGVGVVHLETAGSKVDLEYVAKNYQLKAGDALPYPPCSEGDAVKLQAEGGDYEPFAIEAKCIDQLEVGGPFAVEAGKPTVLTWSKPSDEQLARIEIRLDISHHGGAKGEIKCNVPDTGSFTISATMIDKLLDLGVAGFPTVQLTRVSTSKPSGEPSKVTLSVTMFAERDVTIPGLTSCASDDSQCPMGQTCQTDLTCK